MPITATEWRLVVDGPLEGAANMAIDAALLAEAEQAPAAMSIVRFYQWSRPTLSLGRNQKEESAADRLFCESHGIDIVRRPTGGRAVLHDDELTYAVISNDKDLFGETIYANYKAVSEALCDALNHIGVPAVLAPDTRRVPKAPNGGELPCFMSPSRYELMVHNRKIAGSAQRRLSRSFLQHGSMPITCNREQLAGATGMSDAAILYDEMSGLAEFLPERPSIERLVGALTRSFERRFGVTLRRPGP